MRGKRYLLDARFNEECTAFGQVEDRFAGERGDEGGGVVIKGGSPEVDVDIGSGWYIEVIAKYAGIESAAIGEGGIGGKSPGEVIVEDRSSIDDEGGGVIAITGEINGTSKLQGGVVRHRRGVECEASVMVRKSTPPYSGGIIFDGGVTEGDVSAKRE